MAYTSSMTIWKETKSAKWTALAAVLPTLVGLVACFLVATAAHLAGFY